MSETNVNLGRLLFNMRTERGLSLREFCEVLGISHAYLNKLEKGIDPRTGKDVTPTIETLSKIAAGMGTPLNELLEMCGYYDDAPADKLCLEKLINEFIDAIESAETVTFHGNELNISKSDIIILASREMLNKFEGEYE